jgi:RNA polymerase sigma-70 factor (ECF subfamily)
MENMKVDSIPVSYRESRGDGIEINEREGDHPRESTAVVAATETVALDESHGVTHWSDARLIASVRCDPPDDAALDALVARHWDAVFARCQMLTQNREKALDLAQATWCRLLRARQSLRPDGNFPAYLATIATNLFRDSYRASRRAGPMADHRLESLDAAYSNDDGDSVVLVDIVADIKSLQPNEQALLAIDIDRALEQLSPRLRDVLVARFIDGKSCAEIGLSHGRTEQAISGWIREAIRQMKILLEEPNATVEVKGKE